MASVNARGGKLFFDFRFRGIRCREYTSLTDTPASRRKMEAVLTRIEADIGTGRFEYRNYFPDSRLVARFEPDSGSRKLRQIGSPTRSGARESELFSSFAERWMSAKKVEWRKSYSDSVEHIMQKHLLPAFSHLPVLAVDRDAVLRFRAALASQPIKGERLRSAATVNRIMGILSMILDEVGITYEINNPLSTIKRLKLKRIDIDPFTLEEVRRLIEEVRTDFSDYLTVRFLTGMRTGEIHGLKWDFVDFNRREIKVRETIVGGRTEYTKTDGSQREIQMSPPVLAALSRMRDRTREHSYVFSTTNGNPIDAHNFTNRIWNPLLDRLGLKRRRPYQTRHTAATLWLAAGENPEWIARQMGHTSTQMLFTIYSRFVANLTRRDGSAFEQMLAATLARSSSDTRDAE